MVADSFDKGIIGMKTTSVFISMLDVELRYPTCAKDIAWRRGHSRDGHNKTRRQALNHIPIHGGMSNKTWLDIKLLSSV